MYPTAFLLAVGSDRAAIERRASLWALVTEARRVTTSRDAQRTPRTVSAPARVSAAAR
jgi:hypothetical protein